MSDILVDVIPTLIENTTMQQRVKDGVPYTYRITPVDGYVLHDNTVDYTDINHDTMEEIPKLGYKRGTATCAASYDFVANPREFYAVPEDSVPADQVFGGNNNDHETA